MDWPDWLRSPDEPLLYQRETEADGSKWIDMTYGMYVVYPHPVRPRLRLISGGVESCN